MSWSAPPVGEKLLAGVPENESIQPTATSLEQGLATSGGVTRGDELKRQRRHVAHARARLVFTLGLHLAGFFGNLGAMVMFAIGGEFHFLPLLVILWMVNAGICTWVASMDPDIKFLAGLGYARLPFLFLFYGVFQYIQVKHIFDVYRRRSDYTQGSAAVRAEFHSKTFDGIIEGIPFAWLCLWSFFLVDETMVSCEWYMFYDINCSQEDFDAANCPYPLSADLVRWFFLFAGVMSIITLAMGIIEVDYRVNESVREAIDGSLKGTFLQWSHRFTEAGSRICGIVLLCLVGEPLAVGAVSSIQLGQFLIMPSYAVICFISYYLILATSKAKGAQRDHFLAHMIMACIMWFVNPFRFVDSPGYIMAARHINRFLWMARVFEFVVVVAALLLIQANDVAFPHKHGGEQDKKKRGRHGWPADVSCWLEGDEQKQPVPILEHILQVQPELLVMWITMLLLHAAVSCLGPLRVTKLFGAAGVLTEDTVLDMIPAPADGESDGASVAVRQKVARGISSQVLRVGTGITSQLFAQEEQAFGNFIIEKVLGRGAYGVVVLVRMRNRRGSSASQSLADSPQDVIYAMKLQNTEARGKKGTNTGVLPSREMTADRERDIMRKINHPFIIRLAYYFEVPDRALKDASSGDIITDSLQNHRFHKAIVMEYCPGGDLDAYICDRAFPPGYRQGSREMDGPAAEWLQRSRRFSAEMCVALAFLHDKGIVYRDLKPQNVLLKSGTDSEMHICFTDFGFSKDVGGHEAAAGRLDSLAGTPLYAAPEILAIATRQARVEYTPSVDLFSLGKTICVMLWRVKLMDNPPELKLPSLDDCRGDIRVHPTAWSLIEQLTFQKADQRGKASELESHAFFQEITLLNGEVLPGLKWASLEKAC